MAMTMSEKIKKIENRMGAYIFIGIILVAVSVVVLCTFGPFGTLLGYIAFAAGAIGMFSFWRGFCKYLDKKELEKASSAPATPTPAPTAPAAPATPTPAPTAPAAPATPTPAQTTPEASASPASEPAVPAHTEEAVLAAAKAAREAKVAARETVKAYKAYQMELQKALDEFA